MRRNDSSAVSRRRRPARQRAAAGGLSAAALIVVAACTSGGASAGGGSAGGASAGGASAGGGSARASLAPWQAVLTAATRAQQVTSATETLTVRDNTLGFTTTGTVRIRLKPTLLASENIGETVFGTTTRIKMFFTNTAIFLNEASLGGQFGKPWVRIDLSALPALAGTSGVGLAQMIQSLQSNNFTSQAELFAIARNTRVVGTQTVDGVSTTEYAGSFTAADGIKALPASFRKVLGSELQALGNSPVQFREWIDGQQHVRKMTAVETVSGDIVSTTMNIRAINQPVRITLQRASQTFLFQGSAPARNFDGNLGAKIVPAPPGFALSQDPGEKSGPMNAAGFNSYMGAGNLAPSLHFVRGYRVFYDNPNGDIIEVILFQFATQTDATLFKAGWVPGDPVNSKADPVIPGAEDFDSTTVEQDSADHGVIAINGNVVFVIDDVTSSTAPVPAVETMARRQYAALLAGP
jgi:hypothetical protein